MKPVEVRYWWKARGTQLATATEWADQQGPAPILSEELSVNVFYATKSVSLTAVFGWYIILLLVGMGIRLL